MLSRPHLRAGCQAEGSRRRKGEVGKADPRTDTRPTKKKTLCQICSQQWTVTPFTAYPLCEPPRHPPGPAETVNGPPALDEALALEQNSLYKVCTPSSCPRWTAPASTARVDQSPPGAPEGDSVVCSYHDGVRDVFKCCCVCVFSLDFLRFFFFSPALTCSIFSVKMLTILP